MLSYFLCSGEIFKIVISEYQLGLFNSRSRKSKRQTPQQRSHDVVDAKLHHYEKMLSKKNLFTKNNYFRGRQKEF